MKRLFILAGIVLVFALVWFLIPRQRPQLYATTAIVRAVDPENDLVTVEDYNGFTWGFYGAEDWLPGDCVSMVMNDAGTDLVFDDEIVSVRYSAWELQ